MFSLKMDSRVAAPPVLPQVLDRQGFVILGRNRRPPSPKSWCDLKLQRFGPATTLESILSAPEYAAIALTRRSGGLVPACVASASPSYWPAVGSGTPLSIISAPDRIGGYRFYPRMPRLTLREPLSSGPGGTAASSGTSCDSSSGSTGLECLAVRERAMLRPGYGLQKA